MHCSLTITAEYVKESERLLSNSILKVERPDLEIEQFDDNLDLNANRPSEEQKIIVFLCLYTKIKPFKIGRRNESQSRTRNKENYN